MKKGIDLNISNEELMKIYDIIIEDNIIQDNNPNQTEAL